jgi:hypothetical protein
MALWLSVTTGEVDPESPSLRGPCLGAHSGPGPLTAVRLEYMTDGFDLPREFPCRAGQLPLSGQAAGRSGFGGGTSDGTRAALPGIDNDEWKIGRSAKRAHGCSL